LIPPSAIVPQPAARDKHASWITLSTHAAGAQVAVLNATPDGQALYSVEGFARIGNGITYWHHLA
jgi:hypothetical protein